MAPHEVPLEEGAKQHARASPPLRQRVNTQARPFGERRRSSILVGQRSIDLLAIEHPEQKGPKFVMFVIGCFKKWGFFIAEHDWKAILICLLISGLGLYKVLITPQENDITGYSPYGARARDEYKRYQEFFAQDGLGITVYIFALAKDGGSMIREEYLSETIEMLDDAIENVTIFDREKNKGVAFNDFCRSFCLINEPVRQYFNGYMIQKDLTERGEQLNGRINVSYPISSMFGRKFTLQQNFYGIDFFHDNAETEPSFNVTDLLLSKGDALDDSEPNGVNGTATNETSLIGLDEEQAKRISNIKAAKIVVLQIRAEHEPGWTTEAVKKYEMDMAERFEKSYKSDRLKTYVFSKTYVEEEMVKAGLSLVPYLSLGFVVMACCAIVSVVSRAIYMHQHSLPKIILAIMACVLPFMSCATALGLMFTFHMRFASILCVIPFLVLSIGVDSSYLMIHEWQRVIKHCRDHPNRKNVNVGYRISEVLSEIGPAIMISTLTNIFADGVGAFTSSPEITLLCVGNLISMVIAFCYQMTFYTGLMSMIGKYEIKTEKRERVELQASLRAANLERIHNGSKHQLTRKNSKFHDNTKHAMSVSMHRYVNFVAQKSIALTTVFVYFLYLAFSIWGITRLNINLTTQKLFTADSPLLALDKIRVEYQVPHFTMATVFVNRPGNLSDPARLKRMNSFVESMEKLPGSWGPVGSQYFVRDFVAFEKSFGDGSDFDDEETQPAPVDISPTGPFKESDLTTFTEWPEYSYWGGFIKMDNASEHLQKFFFTTAYHGKEISIWTERGKLLNLWREVVDKYTPEFDASVFHEDGVFLDLIDNMPTDTWQSVLATLVCMAAVCFLFLNSFFTVVIASSCVLSICCGILGILSWWSVDLDPITMAAMVISIGFSVDIPAHVSYHYYQASVREYGATPQTKLVNCLSSVAFPALQAAVSTILCVSSLIFVHIYMAEVFVKTMVLCVVLCNLHGLVFLPAFLILFDHTVQFLNRLSQRIRNGRVSDDIKNDKPNPENGQNRRTRGGDSGPIGPHRHLSKISSHSTNSTTTDRPEVDYEPQPLEPKPQMETKETKS